MRLVVCIEKLEFEECDTLYLCSDKDKNPLYISLTMDGALRFSSAHVHKLGVDEFSICYEGVRK